jgi:hypothetical protein
MPTWQENHHNLPLKTNSAEHFFILKAVKLLLLLLGNFCLLTQSSLQPPNLQATPTWLYQLLLILSLNA